MSKLEKKVEVKNLVLIIAVIILIIVNLIILVKGIIEPEKQQEQIINTITKLKQDENNVQTKDIPTTEEEIKRYLSTLGERDRIQYYCGQYFKYLKASNYTAAYNLLYPEFKEKYFPTQDAFEKYVTNFYPKFYGFDYDDISRQGDIYVLRLKIIDYQATTNSKGILEEDENELKISSSNETNKAEQADQQENADNIQRIVIKENNYNDFVLSFQVK